jgi:hypothetical protein
MLRASRESVDVDQMQEGVLARSSSRDDAASRAAVAHLASPQAIELSTSFVGAGALSCGGAGCWQQAIWQCPLHLPWQQHGRAVFCGAADWQSPAASKHGERPPTLRPASRLATIPCRKMVPVAFIVSFQVYAGPGRPLSHDLAEVRQIRK